MVVETLFMLFSDELTEIQQAGTRILTCIEPVDLLARMFPTEELKRRTDAALEAARRARETLRFTNRAGTDVTYRIGYPVEGAVRVRRRPGQWDHWPSGGMVLTCGADDGIDGRVVVDRGDILLPVQAVRRGADRVRDRGGPDHARSRGDGYQAELVREYMADFDDPDAYGLSHIGWGLDERAKWAALATDSRGHGMELRAFYGNVLFSTGPNDLVGGPNHTSCHLDIPMRGCSLYLDDTPGDRRRRGRRRGDAARPASAGRRPRPLAGTAARRSAPRGPARRPPRAGRPRRSGPRRRRSACGSGSPTGCRAATGCRRGSRPARRRRSGTGSGFAASSAAVYGCCGCSKTSLDRAVLDDPAEVHDGHVVGDVARSPTAGGR